MSRYAFIEDQTVTDVTRFDSDPGGPWVLIPPDRGDVGMGWGWDGSTWTEPAIQYRTVLTPYEWINTWTAAEWRQLKRAAAGELSPTPIAQNVADRIDQFLDAIQAEGGEADIINGKVAKLYDYLVDEGFITEARRDELKQGIAR